MFHSWLCGVSTVDLLLPILDLLLRLQRIAKFSKDLRLGSGDLPLGLEQVRSEIDE